MLDSARKRALSETKIVTIIGPGTSVTGEIVSKGTIRIEGSVSGKVESDDSIVIQETGKVKADLIAGQVVIAGDVEGNVFAHERLEVMAKGRLIGDITAPRVSIAEGVVFEGMCTMKPPGEAKPPAAANQPMRPGSASNPAI